MKYVMKIIFLILLFAFTFSGWVFSATDSGLNYWPKDTWRVSTPEEQGMDSEKIFAMLKTISDSSMNIHSALIIRHGYLVTEAYFAPYHQDTQQMIASCTKSFTSTLVGIALQQGLIKDLQQKVLDFFPEYSFANLDARKKAITIDNLLSMTSGLNWMERSAVDPSDPYYLVDVAPMMASKNPVQYILDHPMTNDPGTRFYYSTGVSHLLAAILQRATGTSPAEYAEKYLFTPLGIKDYIWEKDPQGVNWGGGYLSITPRDMARFGYLYLRRGVWDGQRVIPAEWVETSTSEHSVANAEPNISVSYGYQWWRAPFGYYALGYGGQYIYVAPKYDLVVVFTCGSEEPLPMIERLIIPAIKSEQPLPPNPKATKKMQQLLGEIENPKSKPAPPLPAIATQISGKVIQFEPNSSHVQSFTFEFGQKNTCFLTIAWDYGISKLHIVGLDGLYRAVDAFPIGKGQVTFKGTWVSGNTLILNNQVLNEAERYDFRVIFFDRDLVTVEATSTGDPGRYNLWIGKVME